MDEAEGHCKMLSALMALVADVVEEVDAWRLLSLTFSLPMADACSRFGATGEEVGGRTFLLLFGLPLYRE